MKTEAVPKKGEKISRFVLMILFVGGGINHFVMPATYARIIPPYFPTPAALVAISGIAEIAGGFGLLIPKLRRPAAWGLIALLIAIFPSNIYMAMRPHEFSGPHIAPWMLWARLPLQPLLIAWVWRVAAQRPINMPKASQSNARDSMAKLS